MLSSVLSSIWAFRVGVPSIPEIRVLVRAILGSSLCRLCRIRRDSRRDESQVATLEESGRDILYLPSLAENGRDSPCQHRGENVLDRSPPHSSSYARDLPKIHLSRVDISHAAE